MINSLIGPTQYAFLEACCALGIEDPQFRPDRCPILSCNLTECELSAISAAAAEGLIAAGPYFRGAAGWPNAGSGFGSSHEAAAYSAVHMLARLLNGRVGAETERLAELLSVSSSATVGVDPVTHHTILPALIAQIENGAFALRASYRPMPGDPYLSRGHAPMATAPPPLRVVS